MIRFTFLTDSSGNLNLNVHSWGPWTLGADQSIINDIAYGSWQDLAFNVQSGISNGTYNDFSGPNATVNSNPFSSPVVARNADGRLESIRHGQQRQYPARLPAAPGGGTGWSGFLSSLGGDGLYGGPAIGTNPDGRLEIFAIGSDYTLEHNYQKTANGAWSGWSSLGNDGHDLLFVSAAADADGLLQVFALDDDGDVLVDRQGSNGPGPGLTLAAAAT